MCGWSLSGMLGRAGPRSTTPGEVVCPVVGFRPDVVSLTGWAIDDLRVQTLVFVQLVFGRWNVDVRICACAFGRRL